MATDPATQFQPAGLNIGYQFTPTVTQLGGSHLFGGAGALWAGVGKTALDAAQQAGAMLQASPLNPEVKARMNYGVDQYKAAQDHLAYLKSLGPIGQVTQTTGPGGLTTQPISSIQDPTLAARLTAQMGLTPKPGSGGGGPTVNNPQPTTPQEQGQSDFAQHPEYYFQNPATGNYERRTDAPPITQPTPTQPTQPTPPPEKTPPTTGQMGKGQASAAPAGPTQDQTTAAVQEALQRNRFASSEQGVPADYQPPQQPGGSIWSPMRPSPMAPPAPGQPPQQPAQSQTPAAATQADQVALQQWQNQNAHPVMSSQDALKWMKNQTTLAQDATYLPMGGPGGSPAYAFHIKGGGQNIVPISQMIQKGAGPLVAAQNTSAVLSQTDQMSQPQPGATSMPSGTGAGAPQPVAAAPPATPMPSGTGMAAPQGQPAGPMAPPPAPTTPMPSGTGMAAPQGQPGPIAPPAPGIRDIYGNPLGAYTNVASRGGLTPDQLTAQTTPGGQPAVPAPPPPSNTTIAKADQDSIQAQANAMPKPTGDYKGDRKVEGDTGPYIYYRNDDPKSPSYGRVYTVLPPKAGDYFKQQRWYLGSTGYDTYELPESQMRQYVSDYWGQTGQGPSRDEIANMTLDQLKPWAKQAWYNNNMARTPIDQGTNLTLDTAEQLHNSLKRIADINQTLAKNGYSELSTTDRIRAAAENAAVSLESHRPWGEQNVLQQVGSGTGAVLGRAGGMDRDTALAIKALDQEVNRAQGLLASNQGLSIINPGSGGGQQTPNIHGTAVNLDLANIPSSNVISDAFSGQDSETRSKALSTLQKAVDGRYKDLITGAQEQWQRIDPRHAANMAKIEQGKDIGMGNDYEDHVMPRTKFTSISDANARIATMTEQLEQLRRQLPATAGPTPSPPSASPTPPDEVKSVGEATDYVKTHKPGTFFMLNGHRYMVQ